VRHSRHLPRRGMVSLLKLVDCFHGGGRSRWVPVAELGGDAGAW
jgi:hypothetical protein